MSADRSCGIVVIAFVGSVFSPYYFAARKASTSVDPLGFPAVNISIFSPRGRVWAFTEWPPQAIHRTEDTIRLGDTLIRRREGEIRIDLSERTVATRRPVVGTVRLTADRFADTAYALHPSGRHRWWPVAPTARIEVELTSLGLRFAGSGYADANDGDAPLERDLREWSWSRSDLSDRTAVCYDGVDVDATPFELALLFDTDQRATPIPMPPAVSIPSTRLWRCPRTVRSESSAKAIRTLESSPFYSRTMIETTVLGDRVAGIHESLRLDRFAHPVMQWMLPFRISRRR